MVLDNRRKWAFILGEQGDRGQILRGTSGTMTILETREHEKTIFRLFIFFSFFFFFWGGGGQGNKQFISREHGNRYPLVGPYT